MKDILIKGAEKLSAILDIELHYSSARYNFEHGLPLESSLRNFFRPYFPLKYGFSSGYIVDINGVISNQSDWIIYDSNTFSPLMAKLSGVDGNEWLPFDSVYGCVEVKRTLTEDAFEEAVKQIRNTRKLRRTASGLLQLSPHAHIPRKFLNISPNEKFDEVCNNLYIGIYAFMPGGYTDISSILDKLKELSKNIPPDELPDFIAVHGHYYIRRARTVGKELTIDPQVNTMDSFIGVKSSLMTSGVFYNDLVFQFSQTHLILESSMFRSNVFFQGTNVPVFRYKDTH